MNGIPIFREADPSIQRPPGRWYVASLALHLAGLALFLLVSSGQDAPKAPVVIDLTLEPVPAVGEPPAAVRPILPPAVRRPVPPPPAKPAVVARPVAPRPSQPLELPAREAVSPIADRAAATIPAQPAQPERVAVPSAATSPTPASPATRGGAEVRPAIALRTAGGEGKTTPEKARQRYLREHFTYIRDLVMGKLAYPLQARKMGWCGRVTVSFVVCEDGSARDIRVVESSGYSLLDRCALDTVRKVAPFPKPPVEAEILLPVLFKFL